MPLGGLGSVTDQAPFGVVVAVAVQEPEEQPLRTTDTAAPLTGPAGVVSTPDTVVGVPAVGPFPPLGAPGWTTDSIAVTVAMAATVVAWLVREALRRRLD